MTSEAGKMVTLKFTCDDDARRFAASVESTGLAAVLEADSDDVVRSEDEVPAEVQW